MFYTAVSLLRFCKGLFSNSIFLFLIACAGGMPFYSIVVKEAAGLIPRDARYKDSSDPRVELTALGGSSPGRMVTSRSAGLTTNPLWGFECSFHTSEFPLRLKVWHTDGSADDLSLGEVLLDTSALPPPAKIGANSATSTVALQLVAGDSVDDVLLAADSLGSVILSYMVHPPTQEELDEQRRLEEAMLALPQEPVPLDPGPTDADDADEETRVSYNNILETQRFIEMSAEDSRVLAVTQREMADLLDRVDELGKNEFFDVKYWTQSAAQCWQEREMNDRAGKGGDCAVRLFPSESAILAQKQLRQRLDEDRSLVDRSEMAKRHPLLFNRVVRDESRRELFTSAMEASRAYSKSNNLSVLAAAASGPGSPSKSLTSPLSRYTIPKVGMADQPFSSQPLYNTDSVAAASSSVMQKQKAETAARMQHVPEDALPSSAVQAAYAENVSAASAAVEDVMAKQEQQRRPQTLAEMVQQQQRDLVALAAREATVYQPLLSKFFEYNQVVYAKLDALAELPDETGGAVGGSPDA